MYPKKLTTQPTCNMYDPVVITPCGRLRGRVVEGTRIFRGIRYAEAARFRMLEKVKPWQGVKEAVVFGPVCCEERTVVARDEALCPHYYFPQDENCQYLNIWTQHADPTEKRPVIVWIHGGSFNTGSSCEQFAYDGENLSRFGDVVVVSLNHRLNLLGFLNLSAYGDEYRTSGNLGMADIVMALEWVRDNISAFGGDPANVTLFGHSGGGGKITTLLQSPAADGLFHKGVLASGVIRGLGDVSVEASKYYAERVLAHLGLNAQTIDRIPYYKLARAAAEASDDLVDEGLPAYMWGPVSDGECFLGQPTVRGFRKETAHIPLIVGSVLGEFTHNYNVVLAEGSKNQWSEQTVEKLLNEKFGDKAQEVAAAFSKAYPGKTVADALFADSLMRQGNIAYARLRAQTCAAPIYSYMFCMEGPFNGGIVPWHGADLPYFFRNADCIPASYTAGVTERLQDQMSAAIVAFAECGDPNHAGMPEWQPLGQEQDATMLLDAQCAMRMDHDRALMQLLPCPTFSFMMKRPRADLGGGPRQSL